MSFSQQELNGGITDSSSTIVVSALPKSGTTSAYIINKAKLTEIYDDNDTDIVIDMDNTVSVIFHSD